ncbi:hypothetical protein ACQKND_12740 [Viridibacillus arvi]|uniref:hypothetical protein n=1 Tax=Viridibacillus arvi TaxID=263475 RepID=UPI003D065400
MDKIALKVFSFLMILALILPIFTPTADAATNKIRYSTILKSASGKPFNVSLMGMKERTAKASFDGKYGFDFVWEGANEGDLLYNGNYELFVKNKATNFLIKNYTYNKTRKMVYKIPARFKGQPDLLLIAEAGSSNFEGSNVYYMYNGKLKKAKSEIGYTLRPQNIAKNTFKVASYNNADIEVGYYITTFKLNPKTGKISKVKTEKVKGSNNLTVAKKWKKHWE